MGEQERRDEKHPAWDERHRAHGKRHVVLVCGVGSDGGSGLIGTLRISPSLLLTPVEYPAAISPTIAKYR